MQTKKDKKENRMSYALLEINTLNHASRDDQTSKNSTAWTRQYSMDHLMYILCCVFHTFFTTFSSLGTKTSATAGLNFPPVKDDADGASLFTSKAAFASSFQAEETLLII